MNEVCDTVGRCRTQTSSFVSSANSHFAPVGHNEERSSADRGEREAPPRGALYEVDRFVSLEKAKLLALLIVLGCACNHALLRYKYGNNSPLIHPIYFLDLFFDINMNINVSIDINPNSNPNLTLSM